MKNLYLFLLGLSTLVSAAHAQPPDRPLLPLLAYTLGNYDSPASEDYFSLPAGIEFESVAAVDFNSSGNLVVLHRGNPAFLEFDASGKLLRAFGDGDLFERSHGLTIDSKDNLWVTDAWGHTVMKLDPEGNVLLSLGSRNESGTWDEAAGIHLFDQPNEVALDSKGNFYVVQGHGRGEPRVLKFSPEGTFLKIWGSRGNGPGELAVAHGIDIDANDILYVADRENHRIQQFSTEGEYLGEWQFNAMACSIYLHSDGTAYMTTGFDGEVAQLDMNGTVLGSLGSPGRGLGQLGEAHFVTVDESGTIYVADVVNRKVQLFIPR